MRENWTNLQDRRPAEQILFNICLFRMVGTTEFAEEHGWVTDWNPEETKRPDRATHCSQAKNLHRAYIITNQGLKLPKSEVVVDKFLTPIWERPHQDHEKHTTTPKPRTDAQNVRTI
jgi:hypothetical protein